MGKAEQYGCAFPHRPVLDAIRQATSAWMKASSSEKVENLRRLLAGFEDIISLLIPELAHWMGEQGVPILTPEQNQRVVLSIRRLLSGLCATEGPLVLIIDDLQWLDEDTINRLILGLESSELRGLLLVFCTTDEPSAVKQGRNLLESLSCMGFHTEEHEVTAFNSQQTVKMISEHTGRSEEQVGEIARSIGLGEQPSPLFLRYVVDYISEGGDPNQIRRDGDVLGLLDLRLAQFSPDERELLGLIACSGQVSVAVLTEAAGNTLREVDVPSFLERAERAGVLKRYHHDEEMLGFSHDRLQEACAGPSSSWPARSLTLLESSVSVSESADSLSDAKLFWHVDRILRAAPLLKAHPLRERAIEIGLAASARARRRGSLELAMTACRLSQRMLLETDPAELKGRVFLEYATACWYHGYADTFVTLAEQAERFLDPLSLVPVVGFRMQRAIGRGQLAEAVAMALESSKRLLPDLDDLGRHNDCLLKVSADDVLRKLATIRELKRGHDPVIEAVCGLLATANAAAYVGASEHLGPLLSLQLKLNQKFGITPSLALTLAYWGAILANQPTTLVISFEVGQLALFLAGRHSDSQIEARVRDLVFGMVLCWHHDLRWSIEPLQTNKELATRHGTFEYAGYSLLKSIAYRIFSGEPLATLERDIISALVEFENLGSTRVCLYLRRDLAAVRQLRSPGLDPSSLEEAQFSLVDMLEELKDGQDIYGLLYTATYRLIVAMVYQDYESARSLADEALSLRHGGPGLAHQGIITWLSGLSILIQDAPLNSEEQDLIEAFLAQLKQWTSCAPASWQARYLHLQAEVACRSGDLDQGYRLYEEALARVRESNNLFDETVITSLRARLNAKARPYWTEQSRSALQIWREKTLPTWFSTRTREDSFLKDVVGVTSARSENAMAVALVELLKNQFGAQQVRLVSQSGRVLTSWNADQEPGMDLCLETIRSGKSTLNCCADRAECCLPILVGDQVQAALYAVFPLNSGDRDGRLLFSALISVTELAYSIYRTLGLGVRLGHKESEFVDHISFFTTLVNESGAAMFARDKRGFTLLANPAYARIFERSSEELVGKSIFEVLDPDLAQRLAKSDQLVINSGKARECLENFTTSNGEKRVFAAVRVPLRDTAGKITGVCGTNTDLTAIRQAEEELQRGGRLIQLGTFAGKIAHDLRNLVHAILGNIDFLKLRLPEEPEILECIKDVELATNRATDLVAGILRFCRQPPPSLYPFLVKDLIEEVIELINIKINSSASIRANVADEDLTLCADSSQIYQVVLNLLSNAVQAAPDDGQIEISATKEASVLFGTEAPAVRISVSDNGIGMDDITIKKAFDAFYTTKSHGEGSGLGLSIVKGIVDAHNGRIEIQSSPGEGTTMNVIIPNPPLEHSILK